MVSHRYFKIDGRIVNIASHIISPKNEISINKDKKIKFDDKVNLPSWISLNTKKSVVKLKNAPDKNEIELPFDINLVIEYYSR
jgi:ribosomal protein S4